MKTSPLLDLPVPLEQGSTQGAEGKSKELLWQSFLVPTHISPPRLISLFLLPPRSISGFVQNNSRFLLFSVVYHSVMFKEATGNISYLFRENFQKISSLMLYVIIHTTQILKNFPSFLKKISKCYSHRPLPTDLLTLRFAFIFYFTPLSLRMHNCSILC